MTMKQEIIILILVLSYFALIKGNRHIKCCKSHQRISIKNSTYICENSTNTRIQTNFNVTDLYYSNASGSCVDFYNHNKTAVFVIENESRNISKREDTSIRFFYKCCPLKHVYNTTLHSCVENTVNSESYENFKLFITKDSFISIGLPHCKIISDQIVESLQDIENFNDTKTINSGKFCLDSTNDGKFIKRKCEDDYEICNRIRCIRKCCADGKSIINRGSNCQDTYKYGVNINFSTKIQEPDAPFAIIHGITPPIYMFNESKYSVFLDKKGVFTSYIKKTKSTTYNEVDIESYCIDHAYKKTEEGTIDGYLIFMKETKAKLETKFAVTRWVKLLSCIFLLLTITVYLVLPKMRNFFGKIVLSYSIATFLCFFFLVITQFFSGNRTSFVRKNCRTIGYFSVLGVIWSFTWLHIMCIDIWISFGTPRKHVGPLQINERKRLLQYSFCGWGLPILWIFLILLFESTTFLPEFIQPHVGGFKCYMESFDSRDGNFSYLLFIIVPLLFQQILNAILFIKTIRYCLKVKAEIQNMNDSKQKTEFDAGKERLSLIMKLAVIMGISFSFEIISSIFNFQEYLVTEYIEVIWDTLNCLQGVLIFIVFICKRRVYNDLCEKLKIFRTFINFPSNTTQVTTLNMNEGKNDVQN